MGAVHDQRVADSLFGEADPRQVTLILAQLSLTMDPVERAVLLSTARDGADAAQDRGSN